MKTSKISLIGCLGNDVKYHKYYKGVFNDSRTMEEKVKIERNATVILREALEDCKACQIKKPECRDNPPICFPDVECRDTFDGPVCGPCPQGWCGDGKVHI